MCTSSCPCHRGRRLACSTAHSLPFNTHNPIQTGLSVDWEGRPSFTNGGGGTNPSPFQKGAMIPHYDGWAGQMQQDGGQANGASNGSHQQHHHHQQQEAALGSMPPPPQPPPILTPMRDIEAFNRCVRVLKRDAPPG